MASLAYDLLLVWYLVPCFDAVCAEDTLYNIFILSNSYSCSLIVSILNIDRRRYSLHGSSYQTSNKSYASDAIRLRHFTVLENIHTQAHNQA
jgi:hypothetical protein